MQPCLRVARWDPALLQRQRHQLVGKDVACLPVWSDGLDEAFAKELDRGGCLKKTRLRRAEERAVRRGASPASSTSHALEKTSDRSWTIDLQDMVKISNIDAELHRRRCDDDAVLSLFEHALGELTLGGGQGTMDQVRVSADLIEPLSQSLDLASRIHEHEPLAPWMKVCNDVCGVVYVPDPVEGEFRFVLRSPWMNNFPGPLTATFEPTQDLVGFPTVAESPIR